MNLKFWKVVVFSIVTIVLMSGCDDNNVINNDLNQTLETGGCPADDGALKDLLDKIAQSEDEDTLTPVCGCEAYPLSDDEFNTIYNAVNESFGTREGCYYHRESDEYGRSFRIWLTAEDTIEENFSIMPIYWDSRHEVPGACAWLYLKIGDDHMCD